MCWKRKKKKRKAKRKGLRPLPSWGIDTLQNTHQPDVLEHRDKTELLVAGVETLQQDASHPPRALPNPERQPNAAHPTQPSNDFDWSRYAPRGSRKWLGLGRSPGYARATNSEINEGQFILGRQCHYCGTLVRADASTCSNCGQLLNSEPPPGISGT